MAVIKEFKEFIMRGNALDLAIGVIIGGAFGKIVSSLVEDVITPLLLKPALVGVEEGRIETWAPGGILLGKFIASVISFLAVGFVLFIVMKGMNTALRKKSVEPASDKDPELTTQEKLLVEIRDALTKKGSS
jgi:large conductance mechanosensitive channel